MTVGDEQTLTWDIAPGGETHVKTFQAQVFVTAFVWYCGFHIWQLAPHLLYIVSFTGQNPISVKPSTMKRPIPLNQSRAAKTTTAKPQTVQNLNPPPHFILAVVLAAGVLPPGPRVPKLYAK